MMILASAMASDPERMVSYLTSFVFISTCFLVDRPNGLILEAGLMLLGASHFFLMLATVLFPVQPHVAVASMLLVKRRNLVE